MNSKFEPEDPLLQSLAMDAAELPRAAAAHARAGKAARRRNASIATVAATVVIGGALFFGLRQPIKPIALNPNQPVTVAVAAPKGFVRAYAAGDAPAEPQIPEGASAHEKELLTQLRGVPLLLVKNEKGEVSQVHIFEQ